MPVERTFSSSGGGDDFSGQCHREKDGELEPVDCFNELCVNLTSFLCLYLTHSYWTSNMCQEWDFICLASSET